MRAVTVEPLVGGSVCFEDVPEPDGVGGERGRVAYVGGHVGDPAAPRPGGHDVVVPELKARERLG